MIGSGRIVGLILMILSVVLLIGFILWAVTALGDAEGASSSGMVLGVFLMLIVMAPLFGAGVYLFRKGTVEKDEYARVDQEKTILNMVLAQGQVSVASVAVELGLPGDEVEEMIRDLVGKQLFSGAINWDKGMLYSVESQQLTEGRKCPNCGGDLQFAGKGLIVCPYCGSEVFLTKRAAASTVDDGVTEAAASTADDGVTEAAASTVDDGANEAPA